MGKFLHAFFSPLDFLRAVPQVWDGFQTNIKLMVIAEALVLVFALLLAVVRGLPGRAFFPLRASRSSTRTSFVERRSFSSSSSSASASPRRSTSPEASRTDRSSSTGSSSLTPLVYTAYVTEVYRAGIESVEPSQRMAARSLGLTYLAVASGS